MNSKSGLASRWIAFTLRQHPDGGAPRATGVDIPLGADDAQQELLELLLDDPRSALDVCLSIVEQTEDEWVLANLGAGPLEDLLNGGDAGLLKSIEAAALQNRHLQTALKNVWATGLSEQAKASLQRALGASR